MKDPREIFRSLIELRERLDLAEGDHNFRNEHVLRKLEGSGIETPANEIEINFYPEGGGFFKGGNRVIVYIKDTNRPKEYLIDESLIRDGTDKQPKFHFNWCRTLQHMDNSKRYDDRYVFARSQDGFFEVHAREPDGESYKLDERVKLYVCRWCLSTRGYGGYTEANQKQKTQIVKDFNLGKFLEEEDERYGIKRKPPRSETNTSLNNYPNDWGKIRKKIIEKRGTFCSKCGVDMKQKIEGLHVHHIDKHRYNNAPTNLQVLCALCHQKIHKTMHVDDNVKNFIIRNRPSR